MQLCVCNRCNVPVSYTDIDALKLLPTITTSFIFSRISVLTMCEMLAMLARLAGQDRSVSVSEVKCVAKVACCSF